MIRNVAHLEAFYWVFKLRNFNAAAQQLNITQPTISARIKELEGVLRHPLFERSTRSVQPTAKAQAIFDHVERILVLLDETSRIAHAGDALSGHVRLGLTDSCAVALLPALQQRLREHHPDLRAEIVVDNSHVLFEHITTGTLDAAVLCHLHEHDDVCAECLGYQEVAWTSAAPLNLDRPLTPGDLVGLPIYTNPAPSVNYATTLRWFAEPGMAPHALHICSSVRVILQLVTDGQGAAILPKCLVDTAVHAGKAVFLDTDPELDPEPMYAIHRKRGLNRATKAVIELIRSIGAQSHWLLKDPRLSYRRAGAALLPFALRREVSGLSP